MVVYFYSLDNENNKISFHSEGYYENEKLVFEDKSINNTKIYLTILKDKLTLIRKGNIHMRLDLQKGKILKGYYENEMGLEFKFDIECKKLIINKNRIDINYNMILDKEVISSHKIWIILR